VTDLVAVLDELNDLPDDPPGEDLEQVLDELGDNDDLVRLLDELDSPEV